LCLEIADKIIWIFAVLKQWLLQQKETEARFVYVIFEVVFKMFFEKAVRCHFKFFLIFDTLTFARVCSGDLPLYGQRPLSLILK